MESLTFTGEDAADVFQYWVINASSTINYSYNRYSDHNVSFKWVRSNFGFSFYSFRNFDPTVTTINYGIERVNTFTFTNSYNGVILTGIAGGPFFETLLHYLLVIM
jgi:hypothetical protein